VEGTVLELSIPRRLADRARGLERSEVRARGDLEPNVYQGKISFRLVVREIEAAEPNEGGKSGRPREGCRPSSGAGAEADAASRNRAPAPRSARR
jgi:hypothetical protein